MTSLPILNNLLAIDLQPKTGNGSLRNGHKDLPIALIDFWRWSASNVLGNALRGQLAEFIVGYALDCLSTVRQEWDAYD